MSKHLSLATPDTANRLGGFCRRNPTSGNNMENLQYLKVTIDGEKGVALIVFNRPTKRNAFSQAMIGEIVTALTLLDQENSVRVVVCTGGSDGPFCGTYSQGLSSYKVEN
jgi:1,4-dihydroxy-2-naphthoyl-CoA synthase